jgi:hypothetical protein
MRRLAMLALAGTLAGAACTDSTGPNGSVTGTYQLRTINGQNLPYTFSSGLRLVADDLTLFNDGTYEDVSRYSDGSTDVDEGDYTNYNGAVTFYSTTGFVYQGSVSRDVLTTVLNGFTQVFERD